MPSPDFGPPLGGPRRNSVANYLEQSGPVDHSGAGASGQASAGSTAETAELETGTTVVALTAAEGVVMAADRRMSLGGRFTANKQVNKIERVHPTAVMGISGAVGPARDLVASLRAEASLYESRRGETMSMTALSRTAAHLVRGVPVTPLLAGVDDEGGRVYELDGGGSALADDYAATGSGLQVAYGVLERRYEEEASLPAAREAAMDAVAAASERDTASGNGVTVATVTEHGVETASAEDPADLDVDAAGEVA